MTVRSGRILKIIPILFKIGIWNVVRVLRYRLALQLGILKFKALGASREDDKFFAPLLPSALPKPVPQTLFGWKFITFDGPPDWHCSSVSPDRCVDTQLPWPQALNAVPSDLDVKEIWELSRFYWVPHLAREARNGDVSAAASLNAWLRDWDARNPPYFGVNWSCGQEAAIRVLHCAQAAIILDEVHCPQSALLRFVANSAARIAPTLHYALGQANNHGSAEAAGLFVAGTWLEALNADPRAKQWKELGRRWLENRTKKLILDDGSSNQYSTNYHRVVLDTYCFVEVWRRKLNVSCFSAEFRSRVSQLNRWLYEMTDKATGCAPAFGANDGSLLLSGTVRNYRDFRPSVQLAAALFDMSLAYDTNDFDDLLLLYGIELPKSKLSEQSSKIFKNGGYIILRNAAAAAIMRYPEYEFRPSHADALHLDLHVNGKPILFDGGTYSYAASDESHLEKVAAHNSVEFDGRDQMPKISRFLYGDWLATRVVEGPECRDGTQYCRAGYKDLHGCEHNRELFLQDASLTVKDQLKGFKDKAILRWRLSNFEFIQENDKIYFDNILMDFSNTKINKSIKIYPSFYAPSYLKKERCLLLEVEVNMPGEIVTEINY